MAITRSDLLNAFEYRNGALFHKNQGHGRVRGEEVGSANSKGYLGTSIRKQYIAIHRAVWIMHFGEIPFGFMIDHKNGQKTDNRIENLRLASPSLNSQNRLFAHKNSLTGFLGVKKVKRRYQARIQAGKSRVNLGMFASPEEAHAAYIQAKSFNVQKAVENGTVA